MDDERLELLKNLTELDAVPGREHQTRDFVRDKLDGLVDFDKDGLGSLICTLQGESDSPRIMVPAHLDEVGFAVKDVDNTGCIKFAPLGGWLDQVLLGHEVTVYTRNGPIPGVIGCQPPHLMPSEQRKKKIKRKDMFIDVGAEDDEDAEEDMGIRVGDPIVPRQSFKRMANEDYLMAKAWDNRVGCGILIEMLRELSETEHPNTIVGAATVQEEVGTRGAETAADVAEPDLCMVVDVGAATDVPGSEKEREVALGEGPAVYMLDAGTIPHYSFNQMVLDVAEEEDIPHQLAMIEHGATDARAIHIHERGVPSVLFGVPARYIHSHAGIIHADDVDATLELMKAVIQRLDADTAAELEA